MTEIASQKPCDEVFYHFVNTPANVDLVAQVLGFKSAEQCTSAMKGLRAYADAQEPLPCWKCGVAKRGYNIRWRKGRKVAVCFRCDGGISVKQLKDFLRGLRK